MGAYDTRALIFDFHLHSDCSDGLLTPTALVAYAQQQNVTLLSLTDHDGIAGQAEAEAACQVAGIQFVRGIELSCTWRGQTLHVIGLALDAVQTTTPRWQAHLAALHGLRCERMQLIAERLERRCGTAMAELAHAVRRECATPTRMHLARRLVESGHCASTADAFKRYLTRGRPGYAPASWPELAATVELIRAAQGTPVLAHPARYKLSAGALRALVREFATSGGQALEASCGNASPNEVVHLSQLAVSHGLEVSAGSDFHDPAQTWNRPGRFAKLPANAASVATRLRRDSAA
jgi:predicted metal-dependent phosphoesterase TrpH